MTNISAAHHTSAERDDRHAAEQADKAARKAQRTCDLCKKVFTDERAMRQHRGMYHRKRLEKIGSRERGVGAGVGAVNRPSEQGEQQ